MQFYLESERLILRALRTEDVNGMFELNSNPEVQKYVGNQPITTLAQAKENIEFIQKQYLENGVGRLAVIEKESGEFLGWGGLKLIIEEMNGHQNFYELGYRFLPKHWGKGFATDVVKISIKYAFELLKLDVIYAITDIRNGASKHILEKVGFKFIEIFDYKGQPHNWLMLQNPSL
ncbi:GNAT family N-acetyltransferase [Pedobacter polaris]|uniref:GNAT family N-acetyltransferase n=1 Tax=Pedobacter polaris TaxID=2571273 RepID=A0A4U1CNF7_9SPHI|nr:GNAT family N-acetyltransferase [Pedobacter polaris]TKC08128.1 GNAT family N-acetyltransferase [Pedobacter polaris]